jgi:hypothetical protein
LLLSQELKASSTVAWVQTEAEAEAEDSKIPDTANAGTSERLGISYR